MQKQNKKNLKRSKFKLIYPFGGYFFRIKDPENLEESFKIGSNHRSTQNWVPSCTKKTSLT